MNQKVRILKFASVGLVCAGVQGGIVYLLADGFSWEYSKGLLFAANTTGYLLSTQVNFLLSLVFTFTGRSENSSVSRRWLMFNGMAITMVMVSNGVFVVMTFMFHYMIAEVLTIGMIALLNFTIANHLIFTHSSRDGFSFLLKFFQREKVSVAGLSE